MNLIDNLKHILVHYDKSEDIPRSEIEEILEKHKHALILYPEVATEQDSKGTWKYLMWDGEFWYADDSCYPNEGDIIFELPEKPSVTVEELMPEEPLKVGDIVTPFINHEPYLPYDNEWQVIFIKEDYAWLNLIKGIEGMNNNGVFRVSDLKKVKP